MHLSAISYVHGDARLISDLGEPDCDDPLLADDLLETFRESAGDAVDMAAEAGARTLAAAGVVPDAIVWATESDLGGFAAGAGSRLATALGCPSTMVLLVSGHGCGNLGLLLKVARSLIAGSSAILLVTSDRIGSLSRITPDGLAVLSDGAAAVLATRDAPAPGSPSFVVHDLSISVDAAGVTTRADLGAQRRAVRLGRKAVAGSTRSPQDFTWALFNNYRLSSQKFLCAAGGFSAQQLLLGPVREYAHAFAADLLVNCDLLGRAGDIKPGDRLALSAIGPSSWALIDLEVRTS
jgi:3-oxoacyl-[acyl-carrier-protein] synthase III